MEHRVQVSSQMVFLGGANVVLNSYGPLANDFLAVAREKWGGVSRLFGIVPQTPEASSVFFYA